MIAPIDTFLNNLFEFEMIERNFDDIVVANTVIMPLSLAEIMLSGAVFVIAGIFITLITILIVSLKS